MSISRICAIQVALVLYAHAEKPAAVFPQHNFDFIDQYCIDCHDAGLKKGKVNLEDLSFEITNIEQAEQWQKVLNALNSGEMPPEDELQPKSKEKADFLDDLANTMVAARKSLADTGGKITMSRLNRREYGNTIEALLGVNVDTSTLPADGGAGSFDTVGGSQFISSDQIEQYLTLGRTAIDEAFQRRALQKLKPAIVRIEPEKTINRENEKQAKKIAADQARFSRWKLEVDKAVATPTNQKLREKLEKENKQMAHPIHFYKFVELLEGVPDAADYGFKDAFEATLSHPDWDRSELALHKHYLTLPHRDQGTYLKLAHGTGRIDIKPAKFSPGTYRLRVRVGAVEDAPAARRFIEVGHPRLRAGNPPRMALSGAPLSQHQVTGTIANPQIIETTFELNANSSSTISVRERQPPEPQALWDAHNRMKKENGYGHPPAIWIDWVELEGPLSEAQLAQVSASKVTRVEPEKTINRKQEKTIKGIQARIAKFAEWQKGVDKAAATPGNQAIIEAARKKERLNHPRLYYVFAGRLKGAPNARDFGFIDSAKAAGFHPDLDPGNLALYKHFVGLPHRDRGAHLMLAHGLGRVDVTPKKLPPGNYTLRIAAAAVPDSPASRHFIEVGYPQRSPDQGRGLDGNPISSHQVTGTYAKPQIIEVPIEIGTHTPKELGVQEKQPRGDRLKALWDTHNRMKKENGYGIPPAIWIDWVELEGPHAAPAGESKALDWWISDSEIKDETARARKILEQFSLRAMRGSQPSETYINRLMEIFKAKRKAGEVFDIAIRTPMSIVLASPGFIYLHEPGSEDERRKLDDRELAVRLAYFLWSAPPDGQLLELAKKGELHKPEVLSREVDRLIADSRSDEFISGFVHQWLDMVRLDLFQFDPNLHREFDESMRAASRREVYESFSHLLRGGEQGHLCKLLKSDHVFINGLLANYYGIEGVTGDEYRMVKLPDDSPRGGLLGMAAIHAMGSDGIESSPVERGAWVLRHLLNDPPPPAPPNVPQLSRLAEKPLNTRERLAAHMEEAQCASCHRKIDPIGFGMENFDAAGKWRTTEKHGKGKKQKTWEIDPSGKLHKGPAFADYFELRDVIATREDDFARGFTEHLIEYALGRPFGFTDEDLAIEITTSAKSKDYAVSEFIHAVVRSEQFHTK